MSGCFIASSVYRDIKMSFFFFFNSWSFETNLNPLNKVLWSGKEMTNLAQNYDWIKKGCTGVETVKLGFEEGF